jgi:hypothetical protein
MTDRLICECGQDINPKFPGDEGFLFHIIAGHKVTMGYQIINAKLEDWSRDYSGPKFHACLCDPPYDLSFMGKAWDSGANFKAWGEAILPHLYPGALVLANTEVATCYDGTNWELSTVGNAPSGSAFSGLTSGTNNSMAGVLGTGSSIDIGATTTSAFGTNNANGFFQTSFVNNGSTGTTVNETACEDSSAAGTAIICPTNVKSHAIGIVVAGAGTTGYPKIAVRNTKATATFDASTTGVNGNYAISSATSGLLADIGATTRPTCGNQIIGIITSTETGTSHTVLVRPDALPPCGTTGQVMQATSSTAVGLAALPRTIVASFGDATSGTALTTSEVAYVTIPFACTLSGWHIMADQGTLTIKPTFPI